MAVFCIVHAFTNLRILHFLRRQFNYDANRWKSESIKQPDWLKRMRTRWWAWNTWSDMISAHFLSSKEENVSFCWNKLILLFDWIHEKELTPSGFQIKIQVRISTASISVYFYQEEYDQTENSSRITFLMRKIISNVDRIWCGNYMMSLNILSLYWYCSIWCY